MARHEAGMSRLTERWPISRNNVGLFGQRPSSIRGVKVYKSQNGRTSNQILFTCLSKMNADVDGDLQLCGYYVSCILAIFPNLGKEFSSSLKDLGGEISIVTDNLFEVMAFVLTDPRPSPAFLVAVCQLLLFPFKTISCESYANDMNSAITALKPLAGYATTLTDLVAAEYEVANKIRIMLGSKVYLRSSLLDSILYAAQCDSPLGYCCNYVAGMLSWTDMSEFVLINDVLLVTKSPVLGDDRVASEVQRLHETFKEITQNRTPQYFAITTFGFKARLLDRSKFPHLIEVARYISAKQSSTFSQSNFVFPLPVKGQTFLELVAKHEAFIKENRARSS
ncbi:uncharacterized protein LOC111011432 [Momordica charantia]|uniref:Uncharacterized protein LOC111011432 n=1 Tax=Momordica charantia TaxID=3673 RepID=A0A6J1CGZ7_MOMCH|nr:uncharacterized protein LOC111011432 [Momordica charantia]